MRGFLILRFYAKNAENTLRFYAKYVKNNLRFYAKNKKYRLRFYAKILTKAQNQDYYRLRKNGGEQCHAKEKGLFRAAEMEATAT